MQVHNLAENHISLIQAHELLKVLFTKVKSHCLFVFFFLGKLRLGFQFFSEFLELLTPL
jgi:hypothetical protein